jgi:hypothetical protein
MSENASEASESVAMNHREGWLVQGLHDGRVWADSAEQGDVREFALNVDRTLPATAGWLALEYGRRFPDFDRGSYSRAWEAAIGLVWLRKRISEDHSGDPEAL